MQMEIKQYSLPETIVNYLPLYFRYITCNELISKSMEDEIVKVHPSTGAIKVFKKPSRIISKTIDFSKI